VSKYKSDLLAVKEVRRNNGGNEPVEDFISVDGNKNANHHLGTGVLIHKQILRGQNFFNEKMSYIILTGRWFVIFLNVHAPTEDKSDDTKDSFYEELERVFDKFPKNHMKILFGDFNANIEIEDIFTPTMGNENLHEIN
jgi:hypothetical protein